MSSRKIAEGTPELTIDGAIDRLRVRSRALYGASIVAAGGFVALWTQGLSEGWAMGGSFATGTAVYVAAKRAREQAYASMNESCRATNPRFSRVSFGSTVFETVHAFVPIVTTSSLVESLSSLDNASAGRGILLGALAVTGISICPVLAELETKEMGIEGNDLVENLRAM